MKAIISVFAVLGACALAAPVLPPIDPNNPLTNPATNKDLLLVNPAWAGSVNGKSTGNEVKLTPEQAQTIQNQLITQKSLEAYAAQLSAQAGVQPPAGIAAAGSNAHAAAVANHAQAQFQAQTQAQLQAQVQSQAQAQAQLQAQAQAQAQANAQAQAQSQAQLQAQQAAAQLQASVPVFQVPNPAALFGQNKPSQPQKNASSGGKRI
ncbi:hypothetical protein EV178_003382 [Coemansia sp. RSA 1646]|nr:hypothetical protein EV178_003382 [Coemansia sp. RSA 1646]KAJ1772944.1 hypothetical protein LPJ74_001085 [Coemansia sp. RSA 1843]KAJ2093520.1 hypothetical protein IW138_000373 [Coemansia sp. RSA 986]KAJ2214337.1 hypothetical protein EV179_003119 [Coemansia sp. RSA 487]